jgi:hypothetical protein
MTRYYFEGWIEMDDYDGVVTEEGEFEADLQSDIIETLGDLADGDYDVKIIRSKKLEYKDK